jgi:nicotinamidase-related amidase
VLVAPPGGKRGIREAMGMTATEQRELVTNAVHLCIDMQNIFARGGIWETPWMERVLPAIVEITTGYTARTVFTRFITPLEAEDRPGRWRRYFTKWKCATRSQLPAEQLELIPALRRFAPPATVIDKPGYSAFAQSALPSFLQEKNVSTVIVTGAETDVCVLSTVLDAVDLGLRVIIVEDALCSSFDAGHDALMTLYRNRFAQQIELIRLDELRMLWRDDS